MSCRRVLRDQVWSLIASAERDAWSAMLGLPSSLTVASTAAAGIVTLRDRKILCHRYFHRKGRHMMRSGTNAAMKVGVMVESFSCIERFADNMGRCAGLLCTHRKLLLALLGTLHGNIV